MKNEIILYQPEEHSLKIEVRVKEDTVWLNRQQLAVLFGRDVKTIGKHINNIFIERELNEEEVVAKFATTTQHGAIKDKTQTLLVEYYNLDVIISVGYRVKSKQGTQFRIWANKVLKEYLLKGYAINNRIERIENDVYFLKEKAKEFDLQIKTTLPPNEGIFYNGQIFDAWVFVSNLVKSAKKSLILIDNYIDESVLQLFLKRNKGVEVVIYTANLTPALKTDLDKHNKQYAPIVIKEFKHAHDRFLIIDEKEVFHIGTSLKDLGKKLFAFSKMELKPIEILDKMKSKNNFT
jgi:hypothetical protein